MVKWVFLLSCLGGPPDAGTPVASSAERPSGARVQRPLQVTAQAPEPVSAESTVKLPAASVVQTPAETRVGETAEAVADQLAKRPVHLPDFSAWLDLHFWTDEGVWGSWRIQRHGASGVYRLWNEQAGDCYRGSYETCRLELQRRVPLAQLQPPQGRVVILLHGLVRSRDAMDPFARYLHEKSDFHVINVAYASTYGEIETHANSLARVVENLGAVSELNFVTHSMGGLVLRRYLHMPPGPPRVQPRRVVMLAPPNQGSQLARRFRDNRWMRGVWGQSALEIAAWEPLAKVLATPAEFGIIAGKLASLGGGNPLVDGWDDGVVSIDETRLNGARDFLLLPVSHGSILEDSNVHESTLRFLNEGCFLSEAQRQPIPATQSAKPQIPTSSTLPTLP